MKSIRYSPNTMIQRRLLLKFLCESVVKGYIFQPGPPETYCNAGVVAIAWGLGYHALNFQMTAADIIKHCQLAGKEVDGILAAQIAITGGLVIACYEGKPDIKDEHVAVVYPADILEHSDSWRKDVPCVANVGAHNKVDKASLCFPLEPKYYELPTNGR